MKKTRESKAVLVLFRFITTSSLFFEFCFQIFFDLVVITVDSR